MQRCGQEDPLEQKMAVHSSTVAWKIPWTKEPSRLQSMGVEKGSDPTDQLSTHTQTLNGLTRFHFLHIQHNCELLEGSTLSPIFFVLGLLHPSLSPTRPPKHRLQFSENPRPTLQPHKALLLQGNIKRSFLPKNI